ncbi:MAG: heme-binding protein [Betaproteobacteria bacterium]|nr:heme-binding protein [Betaproteobacteria bacterium]MBL8535070.1 heme-binding protein [Betaproteobacteria bacterium]
MQELTLAQAHALTARAIAKATQDFGRPICVALCDSKGFLVSFARMEGAPVRSIQISQGKGYTAARMGVTTEALLARLHREQIEVGYFCDPLLTALPGGSPLRDEAGNLIGAAGVSGLTSAEDQTITDYLASLCKEGGV